MTTTQRNDGEGELARLVGATLHSRLDGVTASGDLSGPALLRSRRIRRNRALATGSAAALAAIVVVTPVAWSSLRAHDERPFTPATTQTDIGTSQVPTEPPSTSQRPSTPPTTGASGATGTGTAGSVSGTPRPTSAIGGPPLAAADNDRPPARTVTVGSTAPSGPEPAMAWSFGRTLHRGGAAVTLDVGSVWSYTPLANGRGVLLDTSPDGSGSLRIIGPDGSTVRVLAAIPAERSTQVRANKAGTRFTVLVSRAGTGGSDALLTTYKPDGTVVASKSNLRRDVTLVGIVGNRVFLYTQAVGRSYVWDLGTNAIERYTDAGLLMAVDETTGHGALWTGDPSNGRGCTEIVDVTGAPRPLSSSCGRFVPAAFSPDGASLVGYPAGTDGYATTQLDVLDIATGRVVLRIAGAAFPQSDVFLPDGRVGVNAVGPGGAAGTNSLQGCTIAGRCTTWVPTAPMDNDLVTPYRFQD